MNNPYLHELMHHRPFYSIESHRTRTYDYALENNSSLEEFSDESLFLQRRDALREKYSYGIPNEEAIKVICKYSPIWEVGSGTGYWAKLISEQGGQIIASELDGLNRYFPKGNIGEYFPIKILPSEKPDDLDIPSLFTLFICWPPDDSPMAYEYLNGYRGATFIYVGESKGGCCGTYQFFELLENQWQLERTVAIPQYPHIHDYLAVYKRK